MDQKFSLGQFLGKNLMILIALAVFMIWWIGCGGREAFVKGGQNTSDTSTNTVQVPQPIIVIPPYQPQQSGNTVFPINIPSQYNASQDINRLTEQYNELVKQYLAVKTYKDSIQLKDTAGNRVGVVDLTQIVSENTLKSTQPTYQLSFPHTTTTITNTVYPKPKTQVFVGVSAESLINSPKLQQLGMDLLIKNKKENVISIGAVYDLPNKSPGVRVGYYQKIQFKLF